MNKNTYVIYYVCTHAWIWDIRMHSFPTSGFSFLPHLSFNSLRVGLWDNRWPRPWRGWRLIPFEDRINRLPNCIDFGCYSSDLRFSLPSFLPNICQKHPKTSSSKDKNMIKTICHWWLSWSTSTMNPFVLVKRVHQATCQLGALEPILRFSVTP